MPCGSECAGLANAKEDIVTYAAKALTDPRTINKRVIICPEANKASQNDLIALWEHISGKQVTKNFMSNKELDKQIQGRQLCSPMTCLQLQIVWAATACFLESQDTFVGPVDKTLGCLAMA